MADFMPSLPGFDPAIAVILIIVPVLVIYVVLIERSVRHEARETNGKRIIEYGRGMKIAVALCWLICLGFLIAAFLASAEDRIYAISVVLFFLLSTLWAHLETFGVRIELGDSGIKTQSPWRKKREIPWNAVERACYSHTTKRHIIQTKGFGRVRLPHWLNGVPTLLHELESRGIPVTRRKATRR